MTEEARTTLLAVARDSIKEEWAEQTGEPCKKAEQMNELTVIGPGAFVTLHEHGRLRGCIGYLVGDGHRLCDLVAMLAKESAFEDWRFEPLGREELPQCDIEISVLSVPQAIKTPMEFHPGIDGIILTVFGRRAVFLPQVATEQGWGREEMLDNLSLKAGLPAHAWHDKSARFMTFQAEVFGEKQ